MTKTKIIITSDKYPPDYSGSALRICRFAERMKNENYEFSIITQDNGKNYGKENSVTRIKIKTPKILFPLFFTEMLLKANSSLKKAEGDILHCVSFTWINMAMLTINGAFYKRKSILEITLQGDDDPESFTAKNIVTKLMKPLTKYAFSKTDLIIVLNKQSLKSCTNFGIPESKLWFRPNPVDSAAFRPPKKGEKDQLRKKLALPKGFIIANIAIFQKRKNQLDLIYAFEALPESDKAKTFLLFMGPPDPDEPEYYESVKKYIAQKKLENSIILPGFVKNTNEYLRASDLFAFASKGEGFANVLIEAIMSGLPIITSPVEGTDIIVNPRNGRIAEPPTPENFSKLLAMAINKKLKLDPKKIRKDAERAYSTGKIDAQYAAHYKRLLK